MSQVSRRPISRDLQEKMDQIFWNSLVKLNKKDAVVEFLEDILTPTERVMITKRLSMALLLLRGWDQMAISSYLKVSTATVQTVKRTLNFAGKGYRRVVTEIEKDKEWEGLKLDLSATLEEILAGRVGANWKETKPAVGRKYWALRKKQEVL